MLNLIQKKEIKQYGLILIGALVFSLGVNILIVPVGLYNGGFLGIAQIVRTIIIEYLNIPFFRTLDLAGVIYFILNIPLLFLAYKEMGKHFFVKTIFTISCETVFLTIIKIPDIPIIDDVLTACLIGGIVAGLGAGLILRAGGSGGGSDTLGLYFTKKYSDFSVGKIGIFVNTFVYLICAFLFDIEIVIYSVIYTTLLSFMIDRVHYQNINMSVMIFTKKKGIADAVIEKLKRGVTIWDGRGAYTKENTQILLTVVSKYEVHQLKKIVKDLDPHAFMVFGERMGITGNFEKRL